MLRVCPDGTRSSAEGSRCFTVICLLMYLPVYLKRLLVYGVLCSVQSWHASSRAAEGFLVVKHRSALLRDLSFPCLWQKEHTGLQWLQIKAYAGLQSWPFSPSFFSTLGFPGLSLLLSLLLVTACSLRNSSISLSPLPPLLSH